MWRKSPGCTPSPAAVSPAFLSVAAARRITLACPHVRNGTGGDFGSCVPLRGVLPPCATAQLRDLLM